MGSIAPEDLSTQPLRFFIFGNNIAHSLSPTIHNAAFAHYGFPHHYSIHETTNIDASNRKLLNSPDFGGASITFPHKLSVQPLLQSISPSATSMGAVNTIIVRHTDDGVRQLHGDNTDWLGIRNCIARHHSSTPKSAVVIGAGGAARAAVFAISHLGLRHVTIVNRSRATAQSLADSFPEMQFTICEALQEVKPADLIVGCIPADDVREEDIPSQMFMESGGRVVEMSYRPPVSALMSVARKRPGWTVFGGVDVLKEQAYAQFEIWTGRPAPVNIIQKALAERQKL
ncbi:Pentafunctional AROM polypeptide [Cyphellophora attinorum]|uniref:Pentafunctional AROM polypeptide n=1 Tax=Cyphellophora attinorum TaxID=1664694 RepID=A0A0N1P2B2_9EURO|nr:Pentafunctional AROM polypeptide [Phialophora attinorum]KPI43254.1 Pentafunctional AROM polypeptide [Phialophora attinorum]